MLYNVRDVNFAGYDMEFRDFEEKQLSSELIFDGIVVHLYFDKILLPNGCEATREYLKHNGAVCILPLTPENEVVCVRQFRYPFGKVMLEIPAGKLDSKGEDPRSAALRELREETGAVCENLTYLGKFYPSPAILDEEISMYLATGLTFGATDFDEDEFIEIVKIPFDILLDMVCRGEVPDGKTQTAVLRAFFELKKAKKI